jgi:hypothetical protein
MTAPDYNFLADYLVRRWDKLTARLRNTKCGKTIKYTSKAKGKVLNQIAKLLFLVDNGHAVVAEYNIQSLLSVSCGKQEYLKRKGVIEHG